MTTWDGFTTEPQPVTGPDVPDETARVEAFDYRSPRPAAWPEAEFIVGNPPFIGNNEMRAEVGDGYAEAVWRARPKVPGGADFVMQWWDRAARRLGRKGTQAEPNPMRRFGFITTNSITQSVSRRVVERHLNSKPLLSLAFAVPDHSWVKGDKRAAVWIAMTVARRGAREGVLGEVAAERDLNTDAPFVTLRQHEGTLSSTLAIQAVWQRA